MPNFTPFKKKSAIIYNPIWISLLILFVGLFITFGISNKVQYDDELQSQKEFVQVCKETTSKIITHINVEKEFLISGSSFIEASDEVTRQEWKNFNKYSNDNVKFLGVQAIGFSKIIRNNQMLTHISSLQKQGFSEYRVFPEGDRTIYAPILYVEPFNQKNALAFGYDMLSEPIRRKAMESARDTDRPSISGKVTLLLETKKNPQAGIVMYMPVYKNTKINTVETRRNAIVGWVFCVFRMDDLITSILDNNYRFDQTKISLKIYENDTISQKAFLFDSDKSNIVAKDKLKTKTRIIPVLFNDKKWLLVFSQPVENVFLYSAKAVLILIGGIIISLLLSAFFYSLLLTKKRARSIAGKLSSELLHKNQEYERMNKTLNKNYKKLTSSKGKLDSINKELEKAKIKAEESDQLKSAFLANMSHEIRTPMNGIMGFTELLKTANLSLEEHINYIEIIEKSGTRLLNIINDIVDVSKIEAGQMRVSPSATNVDAEMQYLESFFKPEAQNKDIQLVLHKHLANQDTIINTDRDKLYAILINLVKNAIKYTEKGTIEFGYELKGDCIEFFVKDTGIGISKDRQEAIFERFIQADFSDKMARQGAGLGLAISKAYVALLEGKIWVESELNKGSVFYFTIPSTIQHQEKNSIQNTTEIPENQCDIKNLKILVTEDDLISKMLILKVLEGFGSEILTAQNGNEAVEICRNNLDLDLVLMDIQMPIMNGYQATKEIRKFNNEIIILAQTAFALEGDKAKTLEAGCNGYISKPIKKQELSNLLYYFFCKQEN